MMAFDVALHIGTLLAVVLFFFFDWLMIIASYVGDLRQKLWLGGTTGSLLPKIVLATIPGAILGKLFEHKLEAFFYDDPSHIWMIAVTMAVFGIALAAVEWFGVHKRDMKQITYPDAIIIGCFQALAIVPGTSRSGVTIFAALLLGLNRPTAARFSFLIATPIILGACVLKVRDLQTADSYTPILVGILVSALVGIVAIKGLLHYVQNRSYLVFAWYRLAFAAGLVTLFFVRK